MNKFKQSALIFLDSVKGDLTIENILHYIKANTAFTVHFFAENDELMEQFSLHDNLKSKGFIYKDKPFHYIFINKSLSPKEKIEVLIHEIGHLLLDEESLSDYQKEINATLFSHYVLNAKKGELFLFKIWKQKYKIISCVVILSFISTGMLFYFNDKNQKNTNAIIQEEQTANAEQSTNVYVTPTGKKYHTLDCQYVNPTTAKELTLERAKRKYSACKVCRPDKR